MLTKAFLSSSQTPPAKTSGDSLRLALLVLCVYFACQLISRLLIADCAELDEAEQLVLTQGLRWGYGAQPPLYTWLQLALQPLFGTTIFTLTLQKNLLLLSTYVMIFLSAREVTQRNDASLLAAASLLLIPQVGWESQRDLTHSVLAIFCAALTLFVFLRLCRERKSSYYFLFGLCAGLGLLSKYNYGVFLLALLAAALSVSELRRAVMNRKILISLGALIVMSYGHLDWVWHNLPQTLNRTHKFKMAGENALLFSQYGQGLLSLANATLSFLGVILPVFLLFAFRRRADEHHRIETNPLTKLVSRSLLASLLLCLLAVLIFRVTHFKDRWMLPLLLHAPIWLVVVSWSRLDVKRQQWFLRLIAAAALAILVLIPLRPISAGLRNDVTRLNAPYRELAPKLQKAGLPAAGNILAENYLVGGNLKLFFPEVRVNTPELVNFPILAEKRTALVWDASRTLLPPSELLELAERIFGIPTRFSEPIYVEAPYVYIPSRQMKLGMILIGPD